MTTLSIADRVRRIYEFDLTNVVRKLQEPYPEGKGWTFDQCKEAEFWYRRYLHVVLVEKSTMHVPNGPIDAFWHQHILDTRAYRQDCHSIFGYFLDHYPYYGLNGDTDARNKSFERTNEVYQSLFGKTCREMTSFNARPSEMGPADQSTSCGGDSAGCGPGSGPSLAQSCGSQDIIDPTNREPSSASSRGMQALCGLSLSAE